MNNKFLLFFGLGILFLGLIVTLKVFGIPFSLPSQNKALEASKEKGAGENFSGTIMELLARGGNYKCTWDTNLNGSSLQGTAYIQDKNFAADSKINSSGYNLIAHLVGDGSKLYTWTDIPGTPGIVINYSDFESQGNNSANPQQAQAIRQKIDYKCSSWNPDRSKFILPKGVNFQE